MNECEFYFREFRIGKHRIFHHVKIKATALGFAKLVVLLYSAELECILNDAELSAEEKVEKIKAKISEWDVRREERAKEVEGLVKLLGRI